MCYEIQNLILFQNKPCPYNFQLQNVAIRFFPNLHLIGILSTHVMKPVKVPATRIFIFQFIYLFIYLILN